MGVGACMRLQGQMLEGARVCQAASWEDRLQSLGASMASEIECYLTEEVWEYGLL